MCDEQQPEDEAVKRERQRVIFDRIHRSPRIPDRYAERARGRSPQPYSRHSREGGNPLPMTSRIDPQR